MGIRLPVFIISNLLKVLFILTPKILFQKIFIRHNEEKKQGDEIILKIKGIGMGENKNGKGVGSSQISADESTEPEETTGEAKEDEENLKKVISEIISEKGKDTESKKRNKSGRNDFLLKRAWEKKSSYNTVWNRGTGR